MTSIFPIIRRGITTTTAANAKKNLKKFDMYNKRGTKEFKERQRVNPDPEIPIHPRGTRKIGYKDGNVFIEVPEMIPELIVPNLEGCELKPYASFRSRVVKDEFTPADLFNAIYAEKIKKDFEENKLDENGFPLEPSEYELLSPEEAKDRALRTGCDLFEHPPTPLPGSENK